MTPDGSLPSQRIPITHVCGGADGCMCMYDPNLNPNLTVESMIPVSLLRPLLEALDVSARIQRESWQSHHEIAVLDVDDWAQIRNAEVELREALGEHV